MALGGERGALVCPIKPQRFPSWRISNTWNNLLLCSKVSHSKSHPSNEAYCLERLQFKRLFMIFKKKEGVTLKFFVQLKGTKIV